MRDDGTSSASAEEVLAPRLLVSPSSRVQELEKFSHYVGTPPKSAPASFSVEFDGLPLLFAFHPCMGRRVTSACVPLLADRHCSDLQFTRTTLASLLPVNSDRANPVHQANWCNSSRLAILFVLFTLADPRYEDTARNTSTQASRLL